jgi:hypothetical protein
MAELAVRTIEDLGHFSKDELVLAACNRNGDQLRWLRWIPTLRHMKYSMTVRDRQLLVPMKMGSIARVS